MKKKIELEGIFDQIENAITFYWIEKGLDKLFLNAQLGVNTFELSLFIEEYLKTGNTHLDKLQVLGERRTK